MFKKYLLYYSRLFICYNNTMKHEVFWKNPGYKVRPELQKDIKCNYLIVGGGVTGVSLAYFLAKSGAKNIVLIEKHTIASGATGKAAGTLVTRGESDILDLIAKHGQKKGILYWNATADALKDIWELIKHKRIQCEAEFQDTLYCGQKYKTFSSVLKDYEIEKSLDPTTTLLFGSDLKAELNTDIYHHGMLSKGHGLAVNPLMFTQNFSKVVEKMGVKIYENTAFIRANGNVAETHHGDITFKKIILAIDADHPSSAVSNIKSTILVTRPLTKKQLELTGLHKKKIVFDSKKQYDYFKVLHDNRMLFGFGGITVNKKHKKTNPHFPHLATLEKYMRDLFPYLKLKPEYAWAGTFGVTGYANNWEPILEINGNTVSVAGAGTQVVAFMAAQYMAAKLMGKKSKLEMFFK